MSKIEDDFRKALGLDTFRDEKKKNRIFKAQTGYVPGKATPNVPTGHVDLSPGIHEVSFAATTQEMLYNQKSSIYNKIMDRGGTVLKETRQKTSNGVTLLFITYQI